VHLIIEAKLTDAGIEHLLVKILNYFVEVLLDGVGNSR